MLGAQGGRSVVGHFEERAMGMLSETLAGLVLVAVLAAGEGPVTVPDALKRAESLPVQKWDNACVCELLELDDEASLTQVPVANWAIGVMVLCPGMQKKSADDTCYQECVFRTSTGRFVRAHLLVGKRVKNVHSFVMLPTRRTPPAASAA